MEEILLNIDSRYRDIFVNPNECKFRFNFDKTYKNIISARMTSIEVNNSGTYIDSIKQNNYITVHLPNKLNDPSGVKIQLDDGLYQIVGSVQNMFNGLFQELFNTNGGLSHLTIDSKPFAEKYFYFFYLNSPCAIQWKTTDPDQILLFDYKLNPGWYSVYGMVGLIENFIKTKYSERVAYVRLNPQTPLTSFDEGFFQMVKFTLGVFDRRFRSTNPLYDTIRFDTIDDYNGDINTLGRLRNHIYQTYLSDITHFRPSTVANYYEPTAGILDKLNAGVYQTIMSSNPTNPVINDETYYTVDQIQSHSLYSLNIAYSTDRPTFPTDSSTQIYNLLMQINLTTLKVSFTNYFTKTTSSTSISGNFGFYYYYTPYPISDESNYPDQVYQDQTWSLLIDTSSTGVPINLFDKLISNKDYLYSHKFITEAEYLNTEWTPSGNRDIPEFDIDFSTYPIVNPISNGLIDIKKITYPPIGYYLGWRPNIATNQFIFSGIMNNTERMITADKFFDTTGEDYIFLRINDWGYIDFFGKKMFAKILLTTGLGNPKLDDYINKEYRFRQPQDINKLDIELVDWLGNTINLGGFDWSLTLEFKHIINSSEKVNVERNALVFNTVYK
jgi:hypothetical protein